LAVALTFALAQRDEKAAEAFVLGFKDSSAWASIALNAGTAMASTNPELAKRLAGEMSPGPERDQLLERISNLSVNTGP
jgi:hypothetical protein